MVDAGQEVLPGAMDLLLDLRAGAGEEIDCVSNADALIDTIAYYPDVADGHGEAIVYVDGVLMKMMRQEVAAEIQKVCADSTQNRKQISLSCKF